MNRKMIKLKLLGPLHKTDDFPVGLILLASLVRNTLNVSLHNFPLPVNAIGNRKTYEKAAKELVKGANVIGFQTLCGSYHRILLFAQACKKADPKVLIVFGGPHASAVHKNTLKRYLFVDIIFRGESERSFVEFSRHLAQGEDWTQTAGISYRCNGDVHINPDVSPITNLDDLPILDLGLVPSQSHKSVDVEIGRGCPFKCIFCGTNNFFGRSPRMKSPSRFLKELLLLQRKYGVEEFVFMHDNMTVNRSYVFDLCRQIKSMQLNFKWVCSGRCDSLEPNLLREMKQAGCADIFLGIETGSRRMQKIIGKNLDPDQIIYTIEAATSLGINITASFIIGFPQENKQDLMDTLTLALRLRTLNNNVKYVQLHLLSPLPNSPLLCVHSGELAFDTVLNDFMITEELSSYELDLIRNDSESFSNFYYYPADNLNRSQLKRLRTVFEYSYVFRNAIMLIYKKLGDNMAMRLFDITAADSDGPVDYNTMGSHRARMQYAVQILLQLAKDLPELSAIQNIIRYEAMRLVGDQ